MGGIGSGRHGGWAQKETTDIYRSIDVRRWKRDGLLEPHQSFAWQWTLDRKVVTSIHVSTEPERVILAYRYREAGRDWNSVTYPVHLDWTACHLGGQRPWFLCPVVGCGRRVAILYGGTIFACRHCHQLAYRSQREPEDERARRRADRIRDKLGWIPGILNGNGDKPKGMHWRTFERLTAQHDLLVPKAMSRINRNLELLGESLEDWFPRDRYQA